MVYIEEAGEFVDQAERNLLIDILRERGVDSATLNKCNVRVRFARTEND